MAESFSTMNKKQNTTRNKKAISLVLSLLVPPVGLILGPLLLLKGRKLQQPVLRTWGVLAIVAALIGVGGYGAAYYIYSKDNGLQPNTGPIVAYPEDYPQTDLVVCLDRKQTVVITKDAPYVFDVGTSEASGRISVTLANYFLDKTKGDFVIGVGPSKGDHHIDKGECPQQQQ
ncbi:MAG: hypothetical protein WEC17_01025 [Candidatus Saccharimonadales bacterium]